MPETHLTRRKALKMTGAGVVGGLAFGGQATAKEPRKVGHHGELVWGSDGDEWELLEATESNPSSDPAHRPLYIIEPIPDGPEGGHPGPQSTGDPGTPLAGVSHDHVIDTPGSEGGKYSAEWHVKLVSEDASSPPAAIRTLTNMADSNFLKTVSEIEMAESMGKVEFFDTGVVFTCPARPHNHKRGHGRE